MQTVEQLAQLGARGGIEALERLIEHQQLGVQDERPRERHLAALAARQVMTHLVPQVLDPDALKRRGHEPLDLGLGMPVAARRERHVVPHRRGDDLLLDVLEQHADALADLVEVPRRVDAEHRDVALLRLEQAEDVKQHRRLAATVGPEDDGALAALDHEVEPAQVDLRAVGIGVANARDANDDLAHGILHSAIAAAITSTPASATHRSSRVVSA